MNCGAVRDEHKSFSLKEYYWTCGREGITCLNKQSRKRVHQVFEKISDQYDSMNSVITFRRHIAWRHDVMKRMNVKEGSKALDVCTGTGDWAIALAKAVGTHGEVIGLDFSQNMLKIAQDKQEQQALKRLPLSREMPWSFLLKMIHLIM